MTDSLFDSWLSHVGVGHDDDPPGRGSGRFGWGSGENPGQHQITLQSRVDKMKVDGLKESEIAKALIGERATVKDLRAAITIEKNREKKQKIARALELYDKTGGNASEVGRLMGINESSVRSLLNPILNERKDRYTNTAEMIRKIVDEKGMVDVSKYTELYLGVPSYTKDVAISMLEQEGYTKAWVQVDQLGTNKKTTIMVLAKPGISWGEIQQSKHDIKSIQNFTPDEGKTWWTPEFPESVDSKRVYVRYAEDGGVQKDGVIELRRGVEDISLGGSQYAQVRIAVDGTHYMKGMAMYASDDDIPPGYDIIYNTNKKKGTPMIGESKDHEVLKRMKIDDKTGEVDRDNPFGALIKSPKDRDGIITAGGQRHYIDENGNERLSPINKLQDEGDWDSWSRNLSSQFLSKQPMKLIKQQIDLSIADKKDELEKINNLTNPVIKKKLLEDYANSCDANATSLSVQGFKKQAFQVLLPIPDLKDDEIYAPNYEDGDIVALVRYPHGGTFEIPVLKVNNKHKTAKNVMQGASDAVGINQKVAEKLSGADFDGDTALVIPMKSNNLNITHKDTLKGLKDFDAKSLYKLPDDAPRMKSQTKQTEMGKVSNLITDMTISTGVSTNEICQAVKHSMVVIDAEKHHLDYKQSAIDNNIEYLKKKYQGVNEKTGEAKGASTILSRASGEVYVDARKEVNDLSKMTQEEQQRWKEGKKVYHPTGEKKKVQIKDPSKMTPEEKKIYDSGKKVYRVSDKNVQEKVSRMSIVDDAMDLVRDKNNPKEVAYANYANTLKSLANQARKESRSIKPTPVDQTAKKTYAKEVESLNEKLRIAEMNNPKERQAQVIANNKVSEKFANNPDMDFEHRQRAKSVALNQARAEVGAKKERIVITDSEWEAIQANAISTNKLSRIVNNSDLDVLKQRATPRSDKTGLTDTQLSRIKAMSSSGMYTQADIAKALGISTSAVSSALRNQ